MLAVNTPIADAADGLQAQNADDGSARCGTPAATRLNTYLSNSIQAAIAQRHDKMLRAKLLDRGDEGMMTIFHADSPPSGHAMMYNRELTMYAF